jgi:Animal haem peroxidase
MISRRQFFVRSLGAAAGMASSRGVSAAIGSKAEIDRRDGYSRLLPRRPSTEPGSKLEQGLKELGDTMRDNDSDDGRGKIPAGYTYFGQFIDHDLTLDIARLEEASVEGGRVNHRTPFLDLEHVYSGGPSISSFLYRKHGADSHDGAESFLLGATGPSTIPTSLPSTCNDLPRNAQGVALVGDARQDENLIIAQLHVAFLRLHNIVIKNSKLLVPYGDAGSDFAKAQRLVTWHYQWLVRNDFLKKVLCSEAFDHFGSGKFKPMIKASRTGFRIPVEFSVAAFRFGHSMVRNGYLHNDHHVDARLLDDLLFRTGFGPAGNVPVPEDWVIKWERFFEFGGQLSMVQPSRKIDTRIAEGLFHLPVPQMRAFSLAPKSQNFFGADPPELPIRTLLRGARMGLPTGQDVADAVRILQPTARYLKSSEIASGPHEDILTNSDYRFDKQTPLWYYILKEAEVLEDGNCLGTVGSRIVGEVILAALASDPNSYLNVAGPKWTPTLWNADLNTDPLLEISHFLEMSRSDPLTTACSST